MGCRCYAIGMVRIAGVAAFIVLLFTTLLQVTAAAARWWRYV